MDLISGLRQAAAKKKQEEEAARKAAEGVAGVKAESGEETSDATGDEDDEHDPPVTP
jgi:septal ring factor EnvC (AmiA/AmiB activator)